MHQIVFNEISAKEMSAIPTLDQMELVTGLQISENFSPDGDSRYGVVEREGRQIFRYRSKDYRVYFTLQQESVVVQRVLHADSLKDFLFRSGMGSGSEDQRLGESRSFWRLIDEGESAPRK